MRAPEILARPRKSHGRQIQESLKRKRIPLESWKSIAADRNDWKYLIKNVVPIQLPVRTRNQIWTKSPEELLELHVEKRYGAKWYAGKIVDTDIDIDTNEQIWTVLYDDGDEEDYDERQLRKILCLDETAVFTHV